MDLFNNREIAIFFWFLIFLIWVLNNNKVRKSIYGVFDALTQKIFAFALIAMSLYVALILYLYSYWQLWDVSMVKETLYWFFGTALILFFNSNEILRDANYFRNILLNNIKFILVLQFIINFYVFAFWAEILLIPFITLVAVMSAVADTQEKYAPIKKVLDFILASYGVGLAVFALLNIVTDYSYIINITNLGAFLLPPILTLSFLPFIYLLALFMAYESFYVYLDAFIKEDKLLSLFTKWKIFQFCFLRLKKVKKFRKEYQSDLLRIETKEDVINIIQLYKDGKY